MRYRAAIHVLLILVATIGNAQDRQSFHDDALFWQTLSEPEKLSFVQGYELSSDDTSLRFAWLAYEAGLPKAKADLIHKEVTLSGTVFATIITGIDECYLDKKNWPLNIQSCIVWVRMGLSGLSTVDRDKYLVRHR